jgi:hypothetical protein
VTREPENHLKRQVREPFCAAQSMPVNETRDTKPRHPSRVESPAMHIIAIGWLYVTLMVALTESNLTAGVLSFLFYGLAPTALFLWLAAAPATASRRTCRPTGAPP